MATINSLPQATALESTDKFLIETPLAPKSISGALLKEQVTADSLKKGRVMLNEPDGVISASIESMQVGKKYEIYTNSSCLIDGSANTYAGLQVTTIEHTAFQQSYIPGVVVVPVFVKNSATGKEEVKGCILDFSGGSVVFSWDNELVIYKIIEYDEV